MNGTAHAEIPKSNTALTAAGVVLFLALGVGMTCWLDYVPPEQRRNVRAVAVEGELIDAAPRAAPANAPSMAAVPEVPVSSEGAEFLPITFAILGGYFYELPPPGAADPDSKTQDRIPATIRALDKRKISVQGFMVPVRLEKGMTTQFMLVKDQSLCCYGRIPRMNEWIMVKMPAGKPAPFIGDRPVTVFGKIDVSEEIEKGEVLSLYRMDAEDVAGPVDM